MDIIKRFPLFVVLIVLLGGAMVFTATSQNGLAVMIVRIGKIRETKHKEVHRYER